LNADDFEEIYSGLQEVLQKALNTGKINYIMPREIMNKFKSLNPNKKVGDCFTKDDIEKISELTIKALKDKGFINF
jgi:hypothetical protein